MKAGVRAVSSSKVAGQAKPEIVSDTPEKALESTSETNPNYQNTKKH